jgi:UDP-N-acetylglucosamine 1-carboxyvinyltransferase
MSDQLIIYGGKPLVGSVAISGSKNAALPILAAAILADGPVMLHNVPHLKDIITMLKLLQALGCQITFYGESTIEVNPCSIKNYAVPYELVKAMRASVLALGPLTARYQQAQIALPGGCAIGPRPIDLHLAGLSAMGADIQYVAGSIFAGVKGRLKGALVHMPVVSVTATENIMMAACLAEGVTVIDNAAREPEVVDLGEFLIKMGAKIQGLGTSKISIEGVKQLGAAEHRIIPDRIEAGTYLVAAAMTAGCVTVEGVNPLHLGATLEKLKETGGKLSITKTSVCLDMQGKRPKAVNCVTAPYPGFATDLQPQFVAMNSIAEGEGSVTETIFENRFMHVPELKRMGAHLSVQDQTILCKGVSHLDGVPVVATDLRASAALVLAGLEAGGKTLVDRVDHLDRGYEHLEEKLSKIGGKTERVQTTA